MAISWVRMSVTTNAKSRDFPIFDAGRERETQTILPKTSSEPCGHKNTNRCRFRLLGIAQTGRGKRPVPRSTH